MKGASKEDLLVEHTLIDALGSCGRSSVGVFCGDAGFGGGDSGKQLYKHRVIRPRPIKTSSDSLLIINSSVARTSILMAK